MKKAFDVEIQLYPRCEYRTRFEGTSAFLMAEPQYWGSYFRSTPQGGNCDRIAKCYQKTYKNIHVNKNNAAGRNNTLIAQTGAFYGPFTYAEYQERFDKISTQTKKRRKTESNQSDAGDYFLYDEIIKYK